MMDLRLKGRAAIVTGASRGIGLAVTRALVAEGVHVTAGALKSSAELDELAGAGLVRVVEVDLADPGGPARLVAAAGDRIDILVNSAAIILRKPIEEVTDEEWTAIMDVNLHGIFLCSQAVGVEMIKRKQGKIINISSNVSQVLQPLRGVYAVSKAGVSHLTKVMALEWAPHSINVNAIAPAPTLTSLNRKYFEDHPEDLKERIRSIPLGRMGSPQDYVGTAVLLASKASDFMTGQTIFVDGGSILI